MHILVIEDEKKIASFIGRGLKEEGFMVTLAYDGEEGYEAATVCNCDLIVLDLMLPKIDGLSLCKKLRDNNIVVPIIMLTAKDSVKDKVDGLDAGSNDYLTKPFAFEELLARIRVHTRASSQKVETTLRVEDLEMDLITHEVKRGDEAITLTTKEYALLEYFMRNVGKIITRTMISEHVWDINFDTSTNIIDVYINYLRKKIDDNHEKKMIKTIRGRGYILKP